MKRRDFLAHTGAAAALASVGAKVTAAEAAPSAVIAWNRALTDALAKTYAAPTVAARALSMVHEAVYNAWAAYGDRAQFTLAGLHRRPTTEWKRVSLKTIAIGHAAHGVLLDLFPTLAAGFHDTLRQTLSALPLTTPDALAALQLGRAVAVALLQSRHGDGSNQLGGYADVTGYVPVNGPDTVVDPLRWQPLRVTNSQGVTSVQEFATPHWGLVRPFAIASGAALRPSFSPYGPTRAEVDELLALSAGLNDVAKVHVHFFANNPGSVTPPGQWSQFAEMVSAIDRNTLDDDVLLFFVLGQALLDASIACWESKRHYDAVRPITTIRLLFNKQKILAWGGVGRGTEKIWGQDWMPYQRETTPTPAFPEFVSGHSSFSGAAAECIAALRGSDAVTLTFVVPAGSIRFDPTVPSSPVKLQWNSLSAIADAAGYSRRLGGIHFEQGDLKGRALGRQVAQIVLRKYATLVRPLGWDD